MNGRRDGSPAQELADAVARRSYGKLIAFLAAGTRDIAAAEDALSEAFATALATWPREGCPARPEAWLLTVARRKSIDAVRHRRTGEAVAAQLQWLLQESEAAASGDLPDRRLALLFACAHPALEESIHAPLMLQVVLGLDAKAIGSAFLVSPAAMGKRLVRAKERLRQSGAAFDIPEREQMPARLGSVLDAIYAAFAEGWGDPGGTDAARRELIDEAMFLARLLNQCLPAEAEAMGLLALMLYAEARRPARRAASGAYVPFAAQDIARWDAAMLDEAEQWLAGAAHRGSIGRYQLEAAIQSAHVHRRRSGQSNWNDVLTLYDALAGLADSPVIAINRALAIDELRGADAALAAMPDAASDTRLAEYQPYWAARAELLARTGRPAQAREAYGIAIGLERDAAVRRFLLARRAALPES
jgi:RNA polymerase sigma-70 factor (ECF subfamily)